MTLGRYAVVVGAVVLGTLAVFRPALADEPGAFGATAFAGLLATLNTIAAYALALWSADRPLHVFMRSVLGGMLARMVLMLAAVAAGLVVLGLPSITLVAALFGYFVVFLVFEISVLWRRGPTPREA